jgi:hypothetical protein
MPEENRDLAPAAFATFERRMKSVREIRRLASELEFAARLTLAQQLSATNAGRRESRGTRKAA